MSPTRLELERVRGRYVCARHGESVPADDVRRSQRITQANSDRPMLVRCHGRQMRFVVEEPRR
jgi:hypothetical protein